MRLEEVLVNLTCQKSRIGFGDVGGSYSGRLSVERPKIIMTLITKFLNSYRNAFSILAAGVI
jgi:hypothetical protein